MIEDKLISYESVVRLTSIIQGNKCEESLVVKQLDTLRADGQDVVVIPINNKWVVMTRDVAINMMMENK